MDSFASIRELPGMLPTIKHSTNSILMRSKASPDWSCPAERSSSARLVSTPPRRLWLELFPAAGGIYQEIPNDTIEPASAAPVALHLSSEACSPDFSHHLCFSDLSPLYPPSLRHALPPVSRRAAADYLCLCPGSVHSPCVPPADTVLTPPLAAQSGNSSTAPVVVPANSAALFPSSAAASAPASSSAVAAKSATPVVGPTYAATATNLLPVPVYGSNPTATGAPAAYSTATASGLAVNLPAYTYNLTSEVRLFLAKLELRMELLTPGGGRQTLATRVSVCNQTTQFCATSRCTLPLANVTVNLYVHSPATRASPSDAWNRQLQPHYDGMELPVRRRSRISSPAGHRSRQLLRLQVTDVRLPHRVPESRCHPTDQVCRQLQRRLHVRDWRHVRYGQPGHPALPSQCGRRYPQVSPASVVTQNYTDECGVGTTEIRAREEQRRHLRRLLSGVSYPS